MPQPLLSGHQEYVEDSAIDPAIAALHDRVDGLESRIDELEALAPKIKRDAVVMLLSLLTESLRHVASGKMDISEPAANLQSSSSKWDAIIQQYSGNRIGDVLKILLLHGPMNQNQIAAALRTDPSNMSKNIIPKVKALGLIVKNGNFWTLKEL